MPDISDIQPALSSTVAQGGVADLSGGIAYSGVSDAEAAGELAFGGPTVEFIQYGLINRAFAQGPADPSANIEPVNNPLPYWTGPTQVSGGVYTMQWVVDADSPSGYNLRVSLAPGAASDEAYIEQIVPISGSRRTYPSDYVECNLLGVTTLTNASATVKLQYLAADGSTVGPEASSGIPGVPDAGVISSITANAGALVRNARFLRVRIHFSRATASTSGRGVWDITDLKRLSGLGMVVGDIVDPTVYAMGSISQGSGALAFIPNNVGNSEVDFLSTGGISYPGRLVARGVIFPTISANQNDWAPTSWNTSSSIFVNCSAAGRTITGISATGFTEGQIIWIGGSNTAGAGLTLAHASASSLSGNRFACPAGANYVINDSGAVAVQYVPTWSAANPFRVLGKS